MMAMHWVLLVEELSMEAFLRALLPRLLPQDRTFEIHPFQGKEDLLKQLISRLRSYAQWLPEDWRILIVVDRDNDDCRSLKQKIEEMAREAGLVTRAQRQERRWQVVSRIAIEELEAWYFGDWEAVCEAFPGVSSGIPQKAGYRDPDGIAGGTWEAFERILKKYGYFRTGLPKIETARALGALLNPERCRSRSFMALREAVSEASQ